MKCEELKLKPCPVCESLKGKSSMRCWIEQYSNIISNSNDKEFKEYFVKNISCDEVWCYYFVATVKSVFPDKAPIIERLMVLI